MTAAAPAFDDASEGIAQFIDDRLPRLDAPGVVVAVTDRDRLLAVVARGLSDVVAGMPLLPDARFQIGSISKSFAAIIALQEAEAGRLDLHVPVTGYLPWFEVGSRFAPITLHHLLSHSAGLITGTDESTDPVREVWSLRDSECGFAPGEGFSYSNAGYKITGLVLARLTGRPFPELLVDRLFGPLGMVDSDPVFTLASRLTLATPHARLYDDRPTHPGQPFVASPWYESESADGSVVSTASDMCAYARLVLRRGVGPRGRLLSEESFDRFTGRWAEDRDEPGAWYGYGMVTRTVDGRTVIGHSGGMVGFTSYLQTDPEAGLAVVALMNGDEDRRELVRYALAAARAAGAGAAVPPPPPPADPTLVENADDYAGAYRLCGGRSGGELRLAAAASRLLLVHRGDEIVLERYEDDTFLAPHPDFDIFYLRFGRDGGGAVVEVSHGGDWYVNDRYAGPTEFAPAREAEVLTGHYRNYNPWNPSLRIVARKGKLFLSAPWVVGYTGDFEFELVSLGGGRFRAGTEEWRPHRLTFDTVVEGRARRVVFDLQPFYRAFTP